MEREMERKDTRDEGMEGDAGQSDRIVPMKRRVRRQQTAIPEEFKASRSPDVERIKELSQEPNSPISLMSSPIWVLKKRMQLTLSFKYASPIDRVGCSLPLRYQTCSSNKTRGSGHCLEKLEYALRGRALTSGDISLIISLSLGNSRRRRSCSYA